MALNKDEIIAAISARATEKETVEVPEWGGSVNIRRLSARDLEDTGMLSGEESVENTLKVLAVSLCDDEGASLFTLDELEALERTDAAVTSKLFEACARYNGLLGENAEAAAEVFDEAQPDGSHSD